MVLGPGSTSSLEGVFPPEKQLARGKIDVVLHEQELHGGFT